MKKDLGLNLYKSLESNNKRLNIELLSKKKMYFQAPFLVLQLVTNRGLVTVPKRTNQYLEAP